MVLDRIALRIEDCVQIKMIQVNYMLVVVWHLILCRIDTIEIIVITLTQSMTQKFVILVQLLILGGYMEMFELHYYYTPEKET